MSKPVRSIAKVWALVAGAGLLSAGIAPVLAPAALAAESGSEAKDGSKRVCKSITLAGTRLSRRMCRTQEEWDKGQEKAQEGLLKHQMTESTQLEQAPREMGGTRPR